MRQAFVNQNVIVVGGFSSPASRKLYVSMAVDFRVNLVAGKKAGNNNRAWSQSPFVTMESKTGSTPISAAIFQRIYTAANNTPSDAIAALNV